MNNLLVWIGGLAALCLGALFAGPHFVDWNSYRGTFEQEASRLLGREVRVGGEVNLRVLPVPYVSFDKLSIADTASEGGEPLIRAENFKMWLSVPPLLQGILEAYQVELRRPVVELVTNSSGGGNWQSMNLSQGALPFVPGDFSLKSLDLIDGQVVLRNHAGQELTRVENIDGTVSASAIEGPFKFAGTFKWRDYVRRLQLATTAPDSTGVLRLKSSILAPETGNLYLIDGSVSDLSGRPRLTGSLTAKVFGPAGSSTEQQPAIENTSDLLPADAEDADVPGFARSLVLHTAKAAIELKAEIDADTSRLQLRDLTATMQQEGPPQLITGRAEFNWTKDVSLHLSLESRWVDFDNLWDKEDTSAPPLESVRKLLIELGRSLPERTKTDVDFTLDQATLGGQTLSDIRLSAVRRAGPLRVREFHASAPGGTKVSVEGVLSVSRTDPGFDGELAIDGQSMLKFLTWGLNAPGLADGLADGPFSLRGALALRERRFELSEVTADFGATPVTGSLLLGLGEENTVALDLEGHTIDWGRFWPTPFGAGVIRQLTSQSVADAPDQPQASTAQDRIGDWFVTPGTEIRLSLKAANLIDGDRVYREFSTQIMRRETGLAVPVLKFAMDSGLAVDLEGNVSEEQQQQSGLVNGLITARSQQAVADLLKFLDADDLDAQLRERLGSLAPLRLASRVEFGRGPSSAASVYMDGVAQGGRIVTRLELFQGFDGWRDAPAEITFKAENAEAARLLSLLSDSSILAASSTRSDRSGRIVFRASGIPATGMLARGSLAADGLDLDYGGHVSMPPGEIPGFEGQLTVQARDAREFFAVAGLDVAAGAEGFPVNGSLSVERDDGTLRLRLIDLAIGASKATGLIAFTRQTNAPTKLVVDLDVDKAGLPELMRVVLAAQQSALPGTEVAASSGAAAARDGLPQAKDIAELQETIGSNEPAAQLSGIWPAQPFDLTPLDNVEGFVTVRFAKLALEPGLSMTNTELQASLARGRLSVTSLDGSALGGKVHAAFELEKAAAGVTASGKVAITIGGDPDKQAAGTTGTREDLKKQSAAAFQLEFSGRALGPAALIADLEGKGEVTVADASMTGLTPEEVTLLAQRALASQGPVDARTLNEALRAKIKEGELALGSFSVPVTVSDGMLKVAEVKIESAQGKTSFVSKIELSKMEIDSEWRVAAIAPPSGGPAPDTAKFLPDVSVHYAGKLTNIAALEPTIALGAFEREITVRKMEQTVDELERLRKLDETSAKEEAERRKARQEERAREEERRQLEGEGGDPQQPDNHSATEGSPDSSQQDETSAIADGDVNGSNAQTDGTTAESASPPPRPQVRKRQRPPDDVWRPFQISPYQK